MAEQYSAEPVGSRAYFEEVASQWDTMRRSFFSEAVREKALALAAVEPGRLAADAGAGTGFITEALLQKGLRVIAVDQSEAMLAEMRDKFVAYSGALDCRLGDSAALPIADASVDYVFANMYLHHVQDPAAAIREMARTLKPGGKLVLTDLDEHAFDFLCTEHHDRWMGFVREDVRAWLTTAGLDEADVDCVGENCCATSSCGCQQASVSIFAAHGVKR